MMEARYGKQNSTARMHGRTRSLHAVRRHDESTAVRPALHACTPSTRIQEESGSESEQARAEAKGHAFRFPRPCRLVCLRSSLFGFAGQLGIGEALADNLPNGEVEAIPVIHVLPIVVAESLFVEVAKQVERLDRNVGPADSAFKKTPEVLQSVGVNVAVNVSDGMVNDLMGIIGGESIIGPQRIGIESGASFNVFADFRLKRMLLAVRHDGSADLATTFNDPDNSSFVFGSGAGDATTALRDVHVAGLATDEGFIHFDFAGEFSALLALQSETRTVEHKPCCFLSDAQRPVNLKRTDSILAVRDEPYARKPLIETNRGLLEDSPDFDGELPFGMSAAALPAPLIRQETDLVTPTGRASNSVRPAPCDDVTEAVIGIGEIDDRFLQGFWFGGFHNSIIVEKRVLRKYIVTLTRSRASHSPPINCWISPLKLPMRWMRRIRRASHIAISSPPTFG